MTPSSPRSADPTKILTRRELAAVLCDLKAKAVRSKNARLNLIVFRLACCCGLRASEIANLQMADVRTELPLHRRRQGRQTADCTALVGWGHIGRPRRVARRAGQRWA